ncbi:phosphate ABC transporter permease subunit PstC [bacterium]|nr:phosphate ABC transporter permease subunit PstC [bacterium]
MAKWTLGIIATFSLLLLVAITALLFYGAFPFFTQYSLFDFLTGRYWRPVAETPMFGLLPLLWGSLMVTFIAMLFALPLGISTALYFNGVASARVREIMKPIIELFGSVPSVVYGLFGLVILAPFAQKALSLPVGQCALVAGTALGLMVIPTVVSVSEDALSAVPRALIEASHALGATRWETLMRVVLPAAKSGIIASILLGLGRAIGETMTVLMVAGGAAQLTASPLKPVRPITLTIAAEMGETPVGSIHYHSLFAIGVVLFAITLIINIIANKYAKSSTDR